MIPHYFSLLLLLVFLLPSCESGAEVQQDKQAVRVFFPLKEYIKKEADRLNSSVFELDKTIIINDKTEQKLIKRGSAETKEGQVALNTDFHDELRFFSNADINKIAWTDKYQSDTTLTRTGELEAIRYTALEPELRTQEIQLFFAAETVVDSLKIHTKSETALAGSENWLTYSPRQGYHIRTQQSNRAGDPVKIEITALFNP